MKIEGKVGLVTGGASGIGRALTKTLLERGSKFVAILGLNENDGKKTASEFADQFGEECVRFIRCDVTDENLLKKSFLETYYVHQALDIVVNNAGVLSKDNCQMINVNLIPVMNGMIIANDLMTKQKRTEKGVIVNVSSSSGLRAVEALPIGYMASKHGVVGLTKAFRCSSDGFSKDLRAVALCPDFVPTEFLSRYDFLPQDVAQRTADHWKGLNIAVSMSSVIDAFVQAVEDDSMNGALIKIETNETTVTQG